MKKRSIVKTVLCGVGMAVGLYGACVGAAQLHLALLRRDVLQADPASLRLVGQHIIAGFDDRLEVQTLSRMGAIGGIYLSRANVSDLQETADFIEGLQRERVAQGLPALVVTTDQEGGSVNRLSPPLAIYPSLASLTTLPTNQQATAATSIGRCIGVGLRQAGVTMNFGPVVDLTPSGSKRFLDLWTQLENRAISADPLQVTTIAHHFALGLLETGITPTLKHFPGLRSVQADTHIQDADLDLSIEELLRSDWIPFVELSKSLPVAVMVGHVRLPQIDAENPASTSKSVITGVLRQQLGYQGLLITDDLNMGPTSSRGIGNSAVRSLNSGIDYVLVARWPRSYYSVVSALLQALETGALNQAVLFEAKSRMSLVEPPPRPVTCGDRLAKAFSCFPECV